jgi:CRP-like cAMP-binding protein
MYFSYGTFLQKLPMFNNNFSRPFLRELTKCVHEICYSQGEAIFFDKNSDFFDDQSFYFINSGTIEVKPNLDSTFPYKLQKLRDGEHFGEYTFFTGKNRLATAVAYNYS